jgi:hypothetical protein
MRTDSTEKLETSKSLGMFCYFCGRKHGRSDDGNNKAQRKGTDSSNDGTRAATIVRSRDAFQINSLSESFVFETERVDLLHSNRPKGWRCATDQSEHVLRAQDAGAVERAS